MGSIQLIVLVLLPQVTDRYNSAAKSMPSLSTQGFEAKRDSHGVQIYKFITNSAMLREADHHLIDFQSAVDVGRQTLFKAAEGGASAAVPPEVQQASTALSAGEKPAEDAGGAAVQIAMDIAPIRIQDADRILSLPAEGTGT